MREQMAARYTPTSPLSPRVPPAARPLSPQPSRSRQQHNSRKDSRAKHPTLPKYHPSNFPQNDTNHNPAFANAPFLLPRAPQPTVVETPRMMRERQREFIDRAKLHSKIAASPMGVKPDAPRLDPLGSPKGPVTPLALEEDTGPDYFGADGKTGSSPGAGSATSRDAVFKDGDGGKRRTPPRESLTR